MKTRDHRRLSVCDPDGNPIYAVIVPGFDFVNIEVRFLQVVQDDAPPFASNGVIRFNVNRKGFKEVLVALTAYLESLFLKQMDKEIEINEDIFASIGAIRQPRGTKKPFASRSTRKLKGEGSPAGVHDSARGGESAEGDRRGSTADDVAESGNPEIIGEDKDRD